MNCLYSAYSDVKGFPHRGITYNCTRLHWYCARRFAPVVSCTEGLMDCMKMEHGNVLEHMSYLNELFTETEIAALKQYLINTERGDGLVIVPVKLPLPDQGDAHEYRRLPLGGAVDEYMLYKEKGYTLSIPIHGYFDVRFDPEEAVPESRK